MYVCLEHHSECAESTPVIVTELALTRPSTLYTYKQTRPDRCHHGNRAAEPNTGIGYRGEDGSQSTKDLHHLIDEECNKEVDS